jgi:protein SCO1/2
MARIIKKRRMWAALVALACLSCVSCTSQQAQEEDRALGSFSLTERDGRTVTDADLRGRACIVSFIFTRCTQGCPQVAATLADLQKKLAGSDVLLVSFTVDPAHDHPEELQRYAELYGADPHRWLFLTGEEEEIYRLHDRCFYDTPHQKKGEERKPGREVLHSTKLVLIDREGKIRGRYDGLRQPEWPEEEFQRDLRKLRREAIDLSHERWYLPRDFPFFNASLNALCVCLLLAGFLAIRNRLVKFHVACMLTALAVSALFLSSYLYFHLVVRGGEPTRFAEQAPSAPEVVGYVYHGVLLSHTLLAILAAPLALVTAFLGLGGRLAWHVRLARWTLPVWLYVSFTGVVVYWMLYRLYPGP